MRATRKQVAESVAGDFGFSRKQERDTHLVCVSLDAGSTENYPHG